MSGHGKLIPKNNENDFLLRTLLAIILVLCVAISSPAQERRDREPIAVYAERRAKIAAQLDAPLVLRGYTGREESSQIYVFAQEENFYYLTGHNEEGAALVLLPSLKTGVGSKDAWDGPSEILFLPEKNPRQEKWNGVRLSPADPGISQTTGFASVKSLGEMQATLEKLAKSYPETCTILPYQKELGGYPHEKETVDFLQQAAPQAKLKDVRAQIAAKRSG